MFPPNSSNDLCILFCIYSSSTVYMLKTQGQFFKTSLMLTCMLEPEEETGSGTRPPHLIIVHCKKDAQEFGMYLEISKKADVFFPLLSHKTPCCNVSEFFLQYSQAHRSSSFRKYFLSVVSYTAKYSFHVKGNLLALWFNVFTLYTL